MKLHQLKILDCAARHLNITSAARELNMSQPAVSLQLKHLEQEFGLKFYETSNKGMKLTKEGRALIDSIRPVLAELDKIDVHFKSRGAPHNASVFSVGGNNTLSVTVLLEVLEDFREHHKDVQIVMETESSKVIEQQVAQSNIDVALINRPSYFPNCSYEVYGEHETVAFVAADSPLWKESMPLEELMSLPLVAKKDSACIGELRRRGYRPNVALQFIAADAVTTAVRRGLGVGLLFRSRIGPEIAKGGVREIRVPELGKLTHKSFIVYQKRKSLSPIAQEFIQKLRSTRAHTAVAGAHRP